MYIANDSQRFQTGLKHVGGWANSSVESEIQYILKGQGSREGCLRNIETKAQATSIYQFFRHNNIEKMKSWAAYATKIKIMVHHAAPSDYLVEDLLWALVGDYDEYINWFTKYDFPYLRPASSQLDEHSWNPKGWMYYRYQSWLALNQRWDELRERCERILSMEDQIRKDRSYLIDHRFYLALAKGDVPEMEAVLREKLRPRNLSARLQQQSGLTNFFIDSYAVVFAKLAWRNGYEIDIDSPWIPRDWLPIRPPNDYVEPWSFMRNFDIWQPLDGSAAPFSPKRDSEPRLD